MVRTHCTNNQTNMQSPVSNNNNNNTDASTIVQVNVPLFNGLAAMNRAYAEEVIRACAAHYGFEADAAISQFIKERTMEKAPRVPKAKKEKVTKSPKAEKPAVSAIPLPWTGEVRQGLCSGLRLNHGLHTQCTMAAFYGIYCKTCQKQADGSSTGKPAYGNVEDRLAAGITEYRDPKGKQSTPYSTVMKKLSISRESADEAAAKVGITIPDECFEERALARGRPKKDAGASDTESSSNSQSSAKRGRGRPKKTTKVVESGNSDDLISQLVAQANSATPAASSGLSEKQDNDLSKLIGGLTITVQSPYSEDPQSPADMSQEEAEEAKAARKAEKKALKKAKKAKDEEDAKALLIQERKEAKALKKAKKAKDEEDAKALLIQERKEAKTVEAKTVEAKTVEAKTVEAKTVEAKTVEVEEAPPAAPAPTIVTNVTRLGKVYIDQDGFLFDPTTRECAGFWNEETQQIEECDDDEDED